MKVSAPFEHLPLYRLPKHSVALHHGTQQARTWVIVPKETFITHNHLPFLRKILEAVKLDWDTGVCLICLEEQDAMNLNDLPDTQKRRVLVFGLPPSRLNLQVKSMPNQVFTLDGTSYLFSQNLTEIQDNQSYKKSLWSALQDLFSL